MDLSGRVLIAVVCLTMFAGFYSPAHAVQPLEFINKDHATLTDFPVEFESVASVDLNNDRIDEYVTKSPDKGGLMHYNVVALVDNSPTILGEFSGYKIEISPQMTHNIHDILIYKSLNNDFAYRTYQWHPLSSRYRLSGVSQ